MENIRTIEKRLAVGDYQDKMMRTLLRTMKPGRRFRLAADSLYRAGFALGKTEKEIAAFVRKEMKCFAKIRTENGWSHTAAEAAATKLVAKSAAVQS